MTQYLSAALLLTALLSHTAQAQYTGPSTSLNTKHPLAKTTDTKRRIIAEAKYGYSAAGGYLRTDSTKLEWFGSMSHDRYPTIQPYFTYDKAASTELHQVYLADTMEPYSKTQKIYNSNNEVIYSVLYRWNTATATWDSNTRTAYLYLGGKLIQDETQQKVAGKSWLNRTKNEYTYTAGLLDEKISYTFRYAFSSDLKYYSKTNYTYTSGVINSTTTALWDSSASVSAGFYNKSRLYLTFSGKDTTQKISQTWDKAADDWRNVERKSYNFAKGPYSEDLTERWNTTLSGWENYAKDSLIYSGGLLVNHALFEWITGTKSWGLTQLYAFEYTGSNFTTSRTLQWDGSKWIDNIVTNYEYDSYNDVSKTRSFKWDGSGFSPTDYQALVNYYYEEYTPTSVANVSATTAKINLYPNPALNNHSYLDFFTDQEAACTVQVMDMTGKEVYRISEQGYRGDHSVLLQLDQVPNGVYLVNLFSEGQLQAQLKLVK